MPTATSTITKTAQPTHLMLKASKGATLPTLSKADPPATLTTLRKLYNRAARAFLLRDIALTDSLLESAFALIQPPLDMPDALQTDRRKWDILRITLETTVYSSHPPQETVPESLRSYLIDSPPMILKSSYARSLQLFTPVSARRPNGSATYLPSQVLITLVFASLKIGCPDSGRIMIEDWLAAREGPSSASTTAVEPEGDGYEKVLELYCLQVLPKLEQWDYAKEFLDYESELPNSTRQHLKTSLQCLHTQFQSSRVPTQSHDSLPSAVVDRMISSRPYSPTPSSSSSSSLSTTSTHTVVPATPRGSRAPHASTSLSSLSQSPSKLRSRSSSRSDSSSSTATPRPPLTRSGRPGGHSQSSTENSSSTSRSHSSHIMTFPRSHHSQSTSTLRPRNLSTYALIRASLAPHLTSSKLTTFVLLCVLFPLVSLVLRVRHRRRKLAAGVGSSSNTEMVRRRLEAAGGNIGLLGWAWGEIVRAVGDTVKMAGSGLV